jgi:ABC-type sugar transport system substrate-binding protein
MSNGTLKRGAWCASVALAGAVIAGCGSSSSSSSSSASSSAAATTSAAASTGASAATQAAATAAQQTPTGIAITTPLKSKPPTGKTIIFLRCSQPVCTGFQQGLTPAAKALGWNIKYISFPPTPEGTLAALETAIRDKPDGIFSTGLDRAAIESAYKQAQAAKIPVITGYAVDNPAPPVIANIANGKTNLLAPAQAAAWIAADSDCKANIALFNIKLYPILVLTTTAFKADFAKLCPSATVTETDVQATDVGSALPANVVSQLQSNPKINYLAFAFGDMALGVPAALKSAGLSAKIVGYGAAGPSNIANVASGQEQAETGYGIPYGGWRAMDAFARYFEGMSPAIDTTAVNPGQLFSSKNASSTKGWDFAQAPDYQAQFMKLWHVG